MTKFTSEYIAAELEKSFNPKILIERGSHLTKCCPVCLGEGIVPIEDICTRCGGEGILIFKRVKS